MTLINGERVREIYRIPLTDGFVHYMELVSGVLTEIQVNHYTDPRPNIPNAKVWTPTDWKEVQ